MIQQKREFSKKPYDSTKRSSKPRPQIPGKSPGSSKNSPSTSWESVEKWYGGIVGEDGHYYHQHIIIPGLLRLMNLSTKKPHTLLDLACGQGILARAIPEKIGYTGIDLSPSLIKSAKNLDKNPTHDYQVNDVTKPLNAPLGHFSHVSIVLALQNIESPAQVFKNASRHLGDGGKLFIVLNHPCFRIPRQSSWKVDEAQKLQYRRLDRYMSEMKIPIQANPSKGDQSAETWSFHYPLASYCKWLSQEGFVIEQLEEWCSNKVSTGQAAKMENRSREEFPLFMTIVARKI